MTARNELGARLLVTSMTLEGVEASPDGDGTRWTAEGVAFAVLTDAGVELRLDAAVAAAAIRTPDTDSSPRGPEWIRFHPPVLDPHAIDRLEAWFALARRRALP